MEKQLHLQAVTGIHTTKGYENELDKNSQPLLSEDFDVDCGHDQNHRMHQFYESFYSKIYQPGKRGRNKKSDWCKKIPIDQPISFRIYFIIISWRYDCLTNFVACSTLLKTKLHSPIYRCLICQIIECGRWCLD